MSQTARVLTILRKAGGRGVANYEWPQHRILRVSARIGELRAEGYDILCERDYLPNGRATNVFRHIILEETGKKKTLWQKLTHK